MSPRVFISHSMGRAHNPNPRSAKIKECLINALGQHGWDVFHDSIIRPGDPWRLEILNSLVEASAGIILFNKRAMESDWVTAESLILCFRSSLESNFRVVPVFLEGQRRNDPYFNKYTPFQLMESQGLVDDDEEKSPEDVAEEIAESLEQSKVQKPPTSAWVSNVELLLRRIDIDYLQNAAENLGLNLNGNLYSQLGDQSQKKVCLCRNVAEFMHHKSPIESLKTFNQLALSLVIDDVKKVDRFGKHLTAKWVDNAAMETIFYAYRNPEKFGLLTLSISSGKKDISDLSIIQEYINRADIEAGANQLWAFPVGGGAGEGDALKYQIEKAICDEIVKPHERNYDMSRLPDDLDETMNRLNGFAICMLPQEYAKEQIFLSELRKKYPRIVFLVQVGADESNLNLLSDIGGKPLPKLDETKLKDLSLLKSGIESCIKKVSLLNS